MKNIFKKSFIFAFLFGLLLMPSFAYAATAPAPAVTSLKTKILKQQSALGGEKGAGLGEAKDPRIIVANIIKVALTIVGSIIVVLFIYGGYLIMTAAGAEDQVSKGKDTIKNAVIGLFIVLTAYSITTFVTSSLLDATTGSGGAGGGISSDETLKKLQEKI